MKMVQLFPTMSYGDAIGGDVLAIRDIIRSMGYVSDIYTQYIDPKLKDEHILLYKEMPPLKPDDVLIYHLSTGTELNDWIKTFPCRKMMIYHNITPPEYFLHYDSSNFRRTRDGLLQVRALHNTFDYCLADSDFNKNDLLSYGYTCPIDVLPIVIPFAAYGKKPNRKVLRQYSDKWINLMFLGRIAPNKKQEDVIATFYHYHTKYNPKSRLFLVGHWKETTKYYNRLKEYVRLLGLERYVIFTGQVKFNEIIAYYKLADVFVCMSEHEGFCVPLVESMIFNVPIVAYSQAAVPFTLGGSGILLQEKDPLLAAGLINAVVTNRKLRERVLEKQRERLKDFAYETIRAQFISYLTKFLEVKRNKIALINQRYGAEVNGGAETHTRELAERLMPYYDVEVLTTCALEYTTWGNYFPEGLQEVNNVPVRRFSVDKPRNLKCFDTIYHSDRVLKQRVTEDKWIDEQGPLCTKLIQYIEKNKNKYDVFIFVTYLYYLTVRGIGLVKDKAILIPTAHDEAFIRFGIYKQVFNTPRAFAFNTEEERELVYGMFQNQHIPSDILGVGIELPGGINSGAFKKKYRLSEYLIYVGRIDLLKGCLELFNYFIRYKEEYPSDLKLVLMGKAVMPVPEHSDIISLGFVSEEEKYNGMAGAKLLLLPSEYESLSIVVLESLALGVPVVVNGKCEVLRGHCRKSNAGLYYLTYQEFKNAVNYLLTRNDEYSAMMENGRKYVMERYNWTVIIGKLRRLIETVIQ